MLDFSKPTVVCVDCRFSMANFQSSSRVLDSSDISYNKAVFRVYVSSAYGANTQHASDSSIIDQHEINLVSRILIRLLYEYLDGGVWYYQ